jgi:predicted nucleic acid-binding protein
MATWLMDTALFNTLASPKAAILDKCFEANDASIFLSAASLPEIVHGIGKMSGSQAHRGIPMRSWFDVLTSRYADRIHQVDPEIAVRAGAVLSSMRNGLPRHRFHDALLVATAQLRGHGLLTRRDAIFGPWTKVPIATI